MNELADPLKTLADRLDRFHFAAQDIERWLGGLRTTISTADYHARQARIVIQAKIIELQQQGEAAQPESGPDPAGGQKPSPSSSDQTGQEPTDTGS